MAYLDSAPTRDSEPNSKTPNARLQRYWKEIEAYGKATSDWKEQGDKIVKLYLDQHRTAATTRRFAILWSNIETLKPAIYAKTPNVLCSRRYKDPHPVGRTAAEILERATNTTFDLYRVDEVFRMVRDDRLLVARGQAWVRYEADTTGNKVNSEKACVDYVHWCDFGHNVAGTWKDVWLAWRKVYKTRDEATKRFGAKAAEQLTYSAKVDPDGKEEKGEHVACVFEVWDKKKNQTVFMSRDYPEFLEEPAEPPLNFRDFFPCPEPCYGSKTGKSLIPTPDYRYYQDQAMEIDDLTEKIANLTDWLSLKGFIPAGPSGDGPDAVRILIERMQNDAMSNKTLLVPVESWAGFTEKGGSAKIIDWLPIEKVMQALQGAVETRNQLIQDVYQITGISDILRGQTDPDETLGAQELKSQTGARRVRNAKDELARFCRDVGQLVAEVIAEQFQPQTIAEMTGYKYEPMVPPADPAQAQMGGGMASPPMQPGMPGAMPQQSPSGQTFNDEVIKLLRNDRMRGFLIDIETDSTIQPDEDVEKQRRVEFVTAIGQFVKEALPAAQMSPAIVPMLGETLMFMVRGFRAGRGLEETIERSMQQLQQQIARAQANPQPDPKVQAVQMQMQAKMQEMQAQAQMDREKHQLEMQAQAQELQFKQRELEMKMQELQMKLQAKGQELQMKQASQQQDMAMQAQEREQTMAMNQRQQDMDLEASERQHELGMEATQTKHDLGMEAAEAKAKQQTQRPANAR